MKNIESAVAEIINKLMVELSDDATDVENIYHTGKRYFDGTEYWFQITTVTNVYGAVTEYTGWVTNREEDGRLVDMETLGL